ncbi:MAG TPA: P-loop NTPase, partial [Lacipirellulaceae bacterium]|nr:P-loop NTPase [Lacipirellulaceae bacterium]
MADVTVTREMVEKELAELLDPETGRSLARMEQIRQINIDGRGVEVTLGLTTWSSLLWDETRTEAERLLSQKFPGTIVKVRVVEFVRPPERIGEIGLTAKSVIAVGSGKGGVGKSTVAASLAYGLKNGGATVGLMDADVYGPSIPHLLGVNERPHLENGRLQPIVKDDLRVMSMGFLVPPGEAIVWRGPMLHGAITQFLRDTDWGHLDYLIID